MKFIYKTRRFELDEIPVCHLCLARLNLKQTNKKSLIILNCSNINCLSNKTQNKLILYEAFLKKDDFLIYKNNTEERNNRLKKTSPLNIDSWINKGFSENEAKQKLKEFQSIGSKSVKNRFIPSKDSYRKMGYNEEEINEKFCPPSTIKHWMKKGFSEEESKEKIREFQSLAGKGFSTKRNNNPEQYKASYTMNVEYWIKMGFSEEDAKQKSKERQSTFTLEKCISKYGEEEGLKIFQERQLKWKESLNKTLEENGDGRSKQSKFANEIIQTICKELGIEVPKKEKWISSKSMQLNYSYDFTYNNKIIEFNGDFWHANPKYNKPDDIIRGLKITAQEKWNIDKQKIELANKNGYEVLTIWESDYNENKENVIKTCLKFLK